MKKYFNGKGTISGWAAILRGIVPAILINSTLFIEEEFFGKTDALLFLFIIPLVFLCGWFLLSTTKKRLQAFGWTGGWLNVLFPNLTDATYPNGKQEE